MSMGGDANAAALAVPDRTIQIETTDQLRFSPDQINVRKGETVAFVITNSGNLPHEFVIGDEAVQAEHEAEMAAGERGHERDGRQAVRGRCPGRRDRHARLHLRRGGHTLIAGCHVPGHYGAGMKATIESRSREVEESEASCRGRSQFLPAQRMENMRMAENIIETEPG